MGQANPHFILRNCYESALQYEVYRKETHVHIARNSFKKAYAPREYKLRQLKANKAIRTFKESTSLLSPSHYNPSIFWHEARPRLYWQQGNQGTPDVLLPSRLLQLLLWEAKAFQDI